VRTFDRIGILIWSLVVAIVLFHIGYLFHFGTVRWVWDFIHYTKFVSGWIGCGLMLVSLLYIPRKNGLITWGKTRFWYRLHVVTGLVGPLFILLHSYGKYYGFGGLAMYLMWGVFFTGVVGHYLYRNLNAEILYRQALREDVLRELDRIDGDAAKNHRMIAELRQRLSACDFSADLKHESPGRSLKGNPREVFRLWKNYHGVNREIGRLRKKVVAHSEAEHRLVATRRETFLELLALERDTKNFLALKDLFSLWRVFHVPVSWGMWILVGLHFFGWLWY